MTLIQIHEYGRGSGPCPECGRSTGNVAKHLAACRRKRAELAAQADLSPADLRLIERACAHAVHEDLLEPAQRFGNGVTDLDVARLLKALESGNEVVQGGSAGWTVPTGSPLRRGGLARTVQEALRTGLVRALSKPTGPQIRRVYLVPADVHLRDRWDNLSPLCGAPGGAGRRWRLVKNREWADCRACLAEPS